MNTVDVAHLIQTLRPGAQYSVSDNDYDQIDWYDTNQTKPTHQECIDAVPEYRASRALKLFRKERDKLLTESDKYATPDYPHKSEEIRNAWITYRQTLRDLTETRVSEIVLDDTGRELEVFNWPAKPK